MLIQPDHKCYYTKEIAAVSSMCEAAKKAPASLKAVRIAILFPPFVASSFPRC